jgi:hypothetical protein
MEQLYNELSKINFLSFCEKVTYENESSLTFTPKQGFHDTQNKEIYEIKKTVNGYIITDNGITYSNLDHIFEVSEPDVIKNITTILHQTNIKWYGKEFIYNINPNKKLHPQILSYLQGINFLYAMKVFYI